MNRFKYIILLILGLIITSNGYGAVFSSVTDGDWTSNATWGGTSNPGTPAGGTSDDITVNHSVVLNSSIIIKTGGHLTIMSGGILTINGDIEFSNGSYISIELGGQLVVTGSLTNKNNSINVEINGSIDVSGDFENGNGGVIFGTGDIHVDGSFTGTGTTFGQENGAIDPNTTVTGSNLPVELVSFEYTAENSSILLKWITVSESNNDYFTIERSDDGVNFKEIGIVSGMGNTNSLHYYKFSDHEPLSGISYYRLKQTDFDGKFEYVGTLVCHLDISEDLQVVFENPVRADNFNVSLNGSEGLLEVSLYNYNGQLIYKTTFESTLGQININIPSDKLYNGFYLLNITGMKGLNMSYKVIIE